MLDALARAAGVLDEPHYLIGGYAGGGIFDHGDAAA